MSPKLSRHCYEDISNCHKGLLWIEPYLQLGTDPHSKFFELVWFSPLGSKHWQVEWRADSDSTWRAAKVVGTSKIKLPGIKTKQLIALIPRGLQGEEQREYRLVAHGCTVFSSLYKSPSQRVVVFGDFANGGDANVSVARSIMKLDPSLVVMPGDMVYDHGRVSEYLRNFFPVINSNEERGVPILRSRVVAACPGNHDVGLPKDCDIDELCPWDDLFGYFYMWRQPKNGPRISARILKKMIGDGEKANLLRKFFGPGFLRQSNFSFDWLNQHWVLLDANRYVDWSRAELRNWLRADLRASKADWKFVVFHQAAFNSDRKYRNEQRMRLIFDILQDEGVDLVFCGHCHYYERHRPLRFERKRGSKLAANGSLPGKTIIDRSFDGVKNTRPNGIIEIVTGAGGKLVSPELTPPPEEYSETTCKLILDRNSVTVLDIDGRVAKIRQIADNGDELDSIVIDKR